MNSFSNDSLLVLFQIVTDIEANSAEYLLTYKLLRYFTPTILILQAVYTQRNVFVHTSVPASTHFDNIIRGQLEIIEKVTKTE